MEHSGITVALGGNDTVQQSIGCLPLQPPRQGEALRVCVARDVCSRQVADLDKDFGSACMRTLMFFRGIVNRVGRLLSSLPRTTGTLQGV